MTIATEAGHWYCAKTGEPRYTYINKQGEEKNTTLREARKFNWLPSATMIAGCCDKPPLNNWTIDQHLEIAALNPPKQSENFPTWRNRIKDEYRTQRKKVMDLGSAVHGAIERFVEGQVDLQFQEHAKAALTALEEWCGPGPFGVEKSFSHPLGYGGKVDVHKRDLMVTTAGWVSDYKSKEFGLEDLPQVYPNHSMQLSAYRQGLKMPDARCSIIFVSTSIPGLTHTVEVGEDELDRGWKMFKALLKYWQALNRYEPVEEN